MFNMYGVLNEIIDNKIFRIKIRYKVTLFSQNLFVFLDDPYKLAVSRKSKAHNNLLWYEQSLNEIN